MKQKYTVLKTDALVQLAVDTQHTLADDSLLYERIEIVIQGGIVTIYEHGAPLPTIDLNRLKELLAEYDALCPSAPA